MKSAGYKTFHIYDDNIIVCTSCSLYACRCLLVVLRWIPVLRCYRTRRRSSSAGISLCRQSSLRPHPH